MKKSRDVCLVNFSPEAAQNIRYCMVLNCRLASGTSQTKILNRYIFKTAVCIEISSHAILH